VCVLSLYLYLSLDSCCCVCVYNHSTLFDVMLRGFFLVMLTVGLTLAELNKLPDVPSDGVCVINGRVTRRLYKDMSPNCTVWIEISGSPDTDYASHSQGAPGEYSIDNHCGDNLGKGMPGMYDDTHASSGLGTICYPDGVFIWYDGSIEVQTISLLGVEFIADVPKAPTKCITIPSASTCERMNGRQCPSDTGCYANPQRHRLECRCESDLTTDCVEDHSPKYPWGYSMVVCPCGGSDASKTSVPGGETMTLLLLFYLVGVY
jgi:hypothetical protein